MSETREIITLQLGTYTNYVCTHWWNNQEAGFNYNANTLDVPEINHDVLFREGQNQRGQVTYTPRMLLLDLNGSLGHLSREGDLYEDSLKPELLRADSETLSKHLEWNSSGVEVVKNEDIEKPQFLKDLDAGPSASGAAVPDYKLEESVKGWTDFMYSRYHPRSINLINDYKYSVHENEFDTFTNGRELWARGDFREEYSDRMRQYLEECNSCQGFQVLFDAVDGFAGLSVRCLEELADEYGKSMLAVPIVPPQVRDFQNCDSQMSTTIRIVNMALTYGALIEHSSMFLPLSTMGNCWRDLREPRSFPGVSYKGDNLYQTSSILATYLDTISLRYRLMQSQTHLSGFCQDMSNYGRKLNGAGLAFPFPMKANEFLIECLDRQTNKIFTDLSPNTEIGTSRLVQSLCLRGVPRSRLKQPLKSAGNQIKMAAYRCESTEDMIQLYYQCLNHASMSHCTVVQGPHPARIPFPADMFDDRVARNGFEVDDSTLWRATGEAVSSFPVLASVQNSNDLADTIGSLHREAERIKIAKIYRFKETGLETDEYKELLDTLLDFKDLYDEKYDL